MNKEAEVKLAATPAKKKRRKVHSLEKKTARGGYLFTLPFIIGFIVIYLPVVFESFLYSVTTIERINAGESYQLVWAGLANYREALFSDPNYSQILTAGLRQLVLDVPAILIFSLFIAVLLNQKMVGRAAFRAIFFVPVILSTGLIAQIDTSNTSLMTYMSDTEGIGTNAAQTTSVAEIVSAMDIEYLFSNMKIGGGMAKYVSSILNNIYNIVNRSGVQMLIFLAGLQSISPAIYESCNVEGASAWETFWKITFPMISPMILVNFIYTIIDAFTSSTNSVMSYINQVYGEAGKDTLSVAMAWIYFAIVIVAVILAALLMSAFVFYQRRD
ncbi:MAG: sugar ABC transporter permease [Clostridia bacterium]|jgi:ABC-type sugar transport system permease subunit|nr:sugar ABC transporter permease [Clostridia bacterium]